MNAKKSVKNSLKLLKKIINSNKHTKKVAVSAKRILIRAISTNDPRELYNLQSFYPTIHDYYVQSKDYNSKTDPLISILLPTYNTPEEYLRECIESIVIQSYKNWELCIADDKSTDQNVVKVINEYVKSDKRIKLVVRKENGHISEATNSAFKIASGDYIALMDHDDVLWPNALYEMVKVIRSNKKVDFIYSDEDKIDGTGKLHSYPFLKPDFSPEFLESCNYITHFSCIRSSIMTKVSGFRKGYEGAQDWDLFLRISEITSNIIHIPKLLYSWRIHEASTASNTDAKPYVYEAQRKLLVDHIERIGMKGTVETGIITQHRTIKYEIEKNNKLSVVVFVSDLQKTKRLIESLNTYTPGVNYSLFYCSKFNISKDEKAEITEIVGKSINQRFVKITELNKYSKVLEVVSANNILYIEDSVSVMTENWAKIFLSETQRVGVGIVGPVLLDTSKDNIISAGLGLGYGNNGMADMLSGMPFDDPHYTRGLYAKSRRNVSAVNPAVFAVNLETIKPFIDSESDFNLINVCVKMLKKGYRHVYTPYVQFICYDNVVVDGGKYIYNKEDKYLNPNFNHMNGRMEVKA